jgi:hypothetical protein
MSDRLPPSSERRKRRAAQHARPRAADAEPAHARPRPSQRDDAARAALAPLAPGERPPALIVAVALATSLGLGNAIAYAAGATIGGKHPGAGVLAFTGLMALLAIGMWTKRYLAVLAFEALLALIVLFFSLFLVEAGDVLALVVCVFIIASAGWLFWKLVRVMGRLAAPTRQSSG